MKASADTNVDRGWAWIVFLAAFTNFFLLSILYCAGIYNIKLLEMYGESRGTTAWSGGLQLGLFSLAAPVGSLLHCLMGPRITIAIGTAFTTSGFALTFFATSHIYVVITYGAFVGLGCCISYYSSLVTIGFYFYKYRNAAYGFALTGFGFGAMFFPVLLEYLFSNYGFHGCMLIMGGIQSHVFIAAALTRPFRKSKISHAKDSADDDKSKKIESNNGLILVVNSAKSQDKPLENENLHLSLNSETIITGTNEHCNFISKTEQTKSNETSLKNCGKSSLKTKLQPKLCCQRYSDLINISFAAYTTCLLLQGVGLYSMYIHFPAYGDSIGVSENYNSVLMSAIGAGSLACRVFAGIVTNGSKSRTLGCFIGSSYCTAIVCFLGPYMCTGYIGQMAFVLCFSFFGNMYLPLLSPVLIDLTGLHRSVISTGIVIFVMGIGICGGPSFIGFVADITGTYFYTFPLIGACYLIGGLVMLIIPIKRRFASQKEIKVLHPKILTVKADA